jgi:AcrR family transcriptional regulator
MARPRLITDEQILTTMRSCVLEQGAQVSLDMVAGKLGVTGPALLKRFGSRQELMLRALKPPPQIPFVAELRRGPVPDVTLEQQLDGLFVKVFDFFAQMVPCVSALRESGIPHEQVFDKIDSPLHAIHAMSRWVELAVEQGLAECETPESAATAMLGALQTRAFTAHVMKQAYSTRSNREYLHDLAHLFSRALSVQAPAGRRSKAG